MNHAFSSDLPDLIKQFDGYGDYQIYNSTLQPDGRGAMVPTWTPGPTFKATVTLDDSVAMRTAFAQGVTGIYRVVTARSIALPWHTVFKNVKTGQTYRVTTRDPATPPKDASLDIPAWVSAEDYDLSRAGVGNG